VLDPEATCREFLRVLRAGGRLAVLEFGAPTLPGLRHVYLWYFRHVLPRVGALISRHGDAYEYLPASVLDFPSGPAFATMLEAAGFRQIRVTALTFGVVYLYIATKP
jgi:demethylmenaquinone methyltransferase/2-methoxy-6-polyprenyl-1,4-benzoquinol methylase